LQRIRDIIERNIATLLRGKFGGISENDECQVGGRIK